MKHTTAKKKNRITWIILMLAALGIVAGIALMQLNNGRNQRVQPSDTEALNIPFNKQSTLAFIGADGDTLSVIDIEIADNDQKRARGLMYRRSIPENAGMLFIHNWEDIQSFWMKNTYISLDMVFVNAAKEIVTIHAATAPLKEWNYTSTSPALYVVEVNAGYCARNKIGVGDRIEF